MSENEPETPKSDSQLLAEIRDLLARLLEVLDSHGHDPDSVSHV